MISRALSRRLCGRAGPLTITKRYAHAPVSFQWDDPLDSASLFTEDEAAIQETAHSYCQERMLPRVLGEYVRLLVSLSTDSYPIERRIP